MNDAGHQNDAEHNKEMSPDRGLSGLAVWDSATNCTTRSVAQPPLR
jgi:hypothetical protein